MSIPLRHFSAAEFRCKCGCGAGIERMHPDLLMMLDELRDRAGIPLVLSSAYRCEAHNRKVGGVNGSAPYSWVRRGHQMPDLTYAIPDSASGP